MAKYIITLTERALLARLNRKLYHDDKRIGKNREGTRAHSDLGDFYILDWRINVIRDYGFCLDDLVEMARELDLLKDYERVEGQSNGK